MDSHRYRDRRVVNNHPPPAGLLPHPPWLQNVTASSDHETAMNISVCPIETSIVLWCY